MKISISPLMQNHPNPFNVNTTIEFFLANDVKDAKIYIYNMNGAQLKSIPIHETGYNSIIINGGEFNAGMYLYSLIADGQVIGAKQMLLTE